ncbi:ACR3 family arsenite efflux transporter [Methanonatronarchaeum sp. AMET6-2]|uniref:ACR3 family arsenite efflux transporter n=1 Tax=Methanonatronarchaeum sp. AMET6-2 TaxID=2933293 RepID=UPI0011FD52C0|nr:ACR3 family arsenite efflux transporter [Methanonatronarchaeum sp. AMET6-2]RZN61140.1 MAG: ACR3 family arsenite efflux transporter [Methanonatronarchaeia archaeon]UOY09802.1 ACR3 family arsenite efflux transporter [Methanonatronarchaeum sp. AMET6-2]
MSKHKEHDLGLFEKYLTLWVGLCIIAGLIIGQLFPEITAWFEEVEYAGVSVPIAVVLFLMIYPIMVQIDFRRIIEAGKAWKPISTTLFLNWAIKPFLMFGVAWLFMMVIWSPFIGVELGQELMAGMILLGVAPCTAMVLVWTYLSRANMGHALVMTAINSLTMVVLYAPLAVFLLGLEDIIVPWEQVAFGVAIYVALPLAAGYLTRWYLLNKKGEEWFTSFAENLHYVAMGALLLTVIVIIAPQSGLILGSPEIILLVLIPLIVQIMLMFAFGYSLSKKIRLTYEDASPTAIIGASNHFEVAIAMAITLFGVDHGATLAAVTGLLIEIPIMLIIVQIALKTQDWFPVKYASTEKQ